MKKKIEQLVEEQATEKDLEIEEKLLKVLKKIYPDEKQINLQKLYEYASIVFKQHNKNYPIGEIKTIELTDTYGTHIKININL